VVEVDLVLSTTELWNMMTHLVTGSGTGTGTGTCGSLPSIWDYLHAFPCDSVQGADSIECMLRGIPKHTPNTNIDTNTASDATIATPRGYVSSMNSISMNCGSGGFIEFCARYSAYKLWGMDLWETPLLYQPAITSRSTKPQSITNAVASDYCECIISSKRGVLGVEDMTDTTPVDPTEQYLVFVKA